MCTLPRKLLSGLLRHKDIVVPFWAQMSELRIHLWCKPWFCVFCFHWSKSCQKKFLIPYWLVPAGTLRTLAPLTLASRTLVSCCHPRMEVKQRWVTRLSKSNSATRIKPQITRPPSGKSTSASITTRRLFKVVHDGNTRTNMNCKYQLGFPTSLPQRSWDRYIQCNRGH